MNKSFKYLFFFLIFSPFMLFSQQYNYSQIKSAFIYNFANNIQWPNINQLSNFKIAIFGQDSSMQKYLTLLAKTKKVNNLNIEIIYSSNFNKIYQQNPQIIYVVEENNFLLKNIYYSVLTQPILIVSDNSQQKIYSMLNFQYIENNKISFEVNKTNILNQNLIILPKLIVLGGTELDLKTMYNLKEEELFKEKKIVEQQQIELFNQNQLLSIQKDSIKQQNLLIEKKKKSIDSLAFQANINFKSLTEKNLMLLKLKEDINLQKQILNQKSELLQQQQDSIFNQKNIIAFQRKQINQKLSKLNLLNKQISKREKNIQLQKNQLISLQNKISMQKLFIIFFSITLFLSFLFTIFFIRNFNQKKNLNNKLLIKNDEIKAQSEELKQINFELEKLSLVARETDNGILITDANGIILWVNEALFQLIDHTSIPLDIIDKNINILNQDINILKFLKKTINSQKSNILETYFVKNNSKIIWIQLTITPIFSASNIIDKAIIICTDISIIKKAEKEIERKNEELTVQRDHILRQNDVIKQSILYAERIQKALLPNMNSLPNFFDHFLIFKPKDYVSGDFYWFQNFKQHKYSLFAVADCTGHGVPGALLSSIGSRLITEITNYSNLNSPADILYSLNIRFQLVLKQQQEQSLDGMDIIIIKIENNLDNSYSVTYASAKRPLFFYDFKKNNITKFNPARKSIGGILQNNNVEFEEINFTASKNDILYLTTDGYIDQNNSERKRFGTPLFIETIENYASESLSKQKNHLEKELINWQKDELQRDDITILALKFIS